MANDEGTTATSNPLRGFILCATSISHDVRADITQKGTEMGANWKQDLTSDCTHLIVGDVTTPKYRYVAKQRPDVKPMAVSFIEKAHEAWVAGEKIPIYQLEVDHVFPPFTGLKMCLTNINDEQERLVIQQNAEKNGAIYSGDLTKQVTHLIAANPNGKKYSYAKQWNIKIVCLDWFYQSLERGMALNEELFSFDLPEEERGKGAWIRPTIGKRKLSEQDDSNKSEGRVKSDPSRRKIKRAASDRLSSGSQTLWGDIIGQGKAPKPERPSEWGSDAPQRPRQKNRNITPEEEPDVPYINVNASVSIADIMPPPPKKMFHDVSFHVHSYDAVKEEKIREVLRSYDGNTFPSIQELFEATSSRYIIIVPDNFAQSDCPRVSDASRAVQVVTNWWLERCLHEEKFIEPDDYILGRPIRRRNIPGFEKLTISVTRFDGVDYLHVTKAIVLLGAQFCEQLNKSRSLLLVNTKDQKNQKDKTAAAEAWKVAMVSEAWLLECITEGELVPFKKYLLNTSPIDELGVDGAVVKKEDSSGVLDGCNVKFDSAVTEDLEKLKKAVYTLGGIVVAAFSQEVPVTHFITVKNTEDPSWVLRKAWNQPDCSVVSDIWLKLSMKHKTRISEQKYQISQPESLANEILEAAAKKEQESASVVFESAYHDGNDGNPFIIEDIEVQHDIDETVQQLRPLSISPIAMQRTRSESQRSLSNSGVHRTPSKIMPLRTPSKNSPFKSMKIADPKPLDLDGTKMAGLLQNNLAEILKLAKQESKPVTVPKRPPRKFQGRALSNENSIRSGAESLSRNNSLQSNLSAAAVESSTSGKSNSLSRTNSLSNGLGLGDSMLYDSNHESVPQVEFDTQPSQTIHYVDTEAQLEKKKLFEKLALRDDGGALKGRNVVKSTVSAVEIGGPIPRRTTRKTIQGI